MAPDTTHDGGPAFPRPKFWPTDGNPDHDGIPQGGMSLRDYFAGQAMAALLSQTTYGNQGQHCAMYDPNDPAQATTLAYLSYQAADAMIAQRANAEGR